MKKIFVAGHNGMIGRQICKILKNRKIRLITASKQKLNLLDQRKVYNFLKEKKPDQVYICAAVVGGIMANKTQPAKFIYENLMISLNLINSSYLNGVKKILFLGSSCIYPKHAKTPIKEEDLLTGKLEPTNEAYALAKIASLSMCKYYNNQYQKKKIDFRTVMPCNLYGVDDNFNPKTGHVIPSLIHKFHIAKKNKRKNVFLWGDGKPLREFLNAEDAANASVFIMNLSKKKFYNIVGDSVQHINIGTGREISIKNLAFLIKKIVGFKGKIKFNLKMPNGTIRKVLNNNKIKKLGWKPKISLETGIRDTYYFYLKQYGQN